MAKEPSSSQRRHHTWRQSSSTTPKRSRRTAKWLTALASLVLVALFAWILYSLPRRAVVTHILAITTRETHHRAAPPLPFAPEDLAPLSQVNARSWNYRDEFRLQEEDKIESLAAILADLKLRPKDALIVYLSAHGVSEDGIPYLLCRDYDLRSPKTARYELSRLLSQISTANNAVKLLVLDADWIASDPLLGMVINEFTPRAIDEITGSNDSRLWVLLSHSVEQAPLVDYEKQGTVFGQSVVQGLLGKADQPDMGGNDDEHVDLQELYRFVLARCDAMSGGAQTPVLIHAGQGIVSPQNVPQQTLAYIPRSLREGKEKEEGEGEPTEPETEKAPGGGSAEQTTAARTTNGSTSPMRPDDRPSSANVRNPTPTPNVIALVQTDGTPTGTAGAPGQPAGAERPASSATQSSGSSGASSSGPSQQPAAQPAAGREQPVPRAASETPASPSAPNSPRPSQPSQAAGSTSPSGSSTLPASADLQQQLFMAWQMRDQIEARSIEEGWTPIEYAPHLWRELNGLLVDLDLRSRAGKAFETANFQSTVDRVVAGLQLLTQDTTTSRSSSVPYTPTVDRLLEARARFAGSQQLRSFTAQDPDLQAVARAVRTYLRLGYRLPDLVRWHAVISIRLPGNDQIGDIYANTKKLAEELVRFQRELDARRGQPLIVAGQDPLVSSAAMLEQINQRLEQILDAQVGILASQPSDPRYRSAAEDLLRLPLPRAAHRQRLINALKTPGALREPNFLVGHPLPDPKSQEPGDAVWQALAQQIELQLTQLEIGGLAADEIRSQAAQIADSTRLAGSQPEARWQGYRKLGVILQEAHRAVPIRLGTVAIAQEAQQGRADAQTLARLLDARLGGAFEGEHARIFPRLEIKPPPPPQRIDLIVSQGDALKLASEPVPVEVTIESPNPDLRQAVLTATYDASSIQVLDAQGAPVPPGQAKPIDLGSTGSLRLAWQALATRAADGSAGDDQTLTLEVRSGSITSQRELRCLLPRPNDVELIVERLEPQAEGRRFGRNVTELRPFPNRPTPFRFLLQNLSGREKEVRVALYRIPGNVWAPGKLVDESGEPFAELVDMMFRPGTTEVLATMRPWKEIASPLHLPTDAKVPVDFSPPAPADPASAANVADPASSAGQAASSEVDITSGLVMVIEDAAQGDRWVKWIQINPVPPRDYVSVESHYEDRMLTVDVRLRDADLDGRIDMFPPGLAQKALTVTWDLGGQLPPGTNQNFEVSLTRQNPAGQLYAMVEPQPNRSLQIPIDVEGYPRAFVQEIGLDVDGDGRDIRGSRAVVHIETLAMKGFPRIYYSSRPPVLTSTSASGAAGGEPPELVRLVAGQPAYFPVTLNAVPGEARLLDVSLRVDAPLDSFTRRGENESVTLGLVRTNVASQKFFSDRQMTAVVQSVDATVFTVLCAVRDFAVPVDLLGLVGRVPLRGELAAANAAPRNHQVELVLDADLPTITPVHVPPRASVGEPLDVSVEIRDTSGPARVEAGLVSNETMPLQPDQAVVLENFPASSTGSQWPVNVRIPSAGRQPGDYVIKVKVIDRVRREVERVVGRVTLVPPRPTQPGNTPQGPLIGTVRGYVRFGPTYRPPRIQVRIEGANAPPVVTSDGGEFAFPRIRPGKYKLVASGAVNGYLKEGQLEVEIKEQADYQRQWVIELETPTRP